MLIFRSHFFPMKTKSVLCSMWNLEFLCEITSLILNIISMIKDTYRSILTAEKSIHTPSPQKNIYLLVRQMKTPHPILKALPWVVLWSRCNCMALSLWHSNNNTQNILIYLGAGETRTFKPWRVIIFSWKSDPWVKGIENTFLKHRDGRKWPQSKKLNGYKQKL